LDTAGQANGLTSDANKSHAKDWPKDWVRAVPTSPGNKDNLMPQQGILGDMHNASSLNDRMDAIVKEAQEQIGNKKKKKLRKNFRSDKAYYAFGEGASRGCRSLTLFGKTDSTYPQIF
jgi:hypothetical protein